MLDVFEIDKIAVTHYRYRLELLLIKEENIEIKPILESQLKEKLELIDEIIECHNNHNEKQRKEQWDRYQTPICKALLMYKEDLEKCRNTMSKFGTNKIYLNTRKTTDLLDTIDRRLASFGPTISELEQYPQYSLV